jgi:hypothetical protein
MRTTSWVATMQQCCCPRLFTCSTRCFVTVCVNCKSRGRFALVHGVPCGLLNNERALFRFDCDNERVLFRFDCETTRNFPVDPHPGEYPGILLRYFGNCQWTANHGMDAVASTRCPICSLLKLRPTPRVIPSITRHARLECWTV